jgi:hypothetical protein
VAIVSPEHPWAQRKRVQAGEFSGQFWMQEPVREIGSAGAPRPRGSVRGLPLWGLIAWNLSTPGCRASRRRSIGEVSPSSMAPLIQGIQRPDRWIWCITGWLGIKRSGPGATLHSRHLRVCGKATIMTKIGLGKKFGTATGAV